MGKLLRCSSWWNTSRCQTSTAGYIPVCYKVNNLFIEPQNLLLMGFICKLNDLDLIVTPFDGLLMIFLHFVCKLLSNPWEHQSATMLSEVFCLRLLISINQFVHAFLIDVIVTFSRVPGPIHVVRLRNEFMSIIFSATKVLYNISCISGLSIFQCPAHFPRTCLRLFIDGHNAQFHCIKAKLHDRRHLLYVLGLGQDHCWSVGRGHPSKKVYVWTTYIKFFTKLSTHLLSKHINNKLV